MTQLTWYIARASGIVGWALLSASVLWGLALSTKALGKRPRPNWLLDLHRFLGGAAVVFTIIHVGSLLVDSYTDISLANVLVPLTGTWHPIAVAWGVVGMYLLAAVEITSLMRKRMSKRVWKRTHYLSFPLFAFSTIHLITAGTDMGNPILRWSLVGVIGAFAILTWVRIEDAGKPSAFDRERIPNREKLEVG
ncbi:MAG: ferric reductase-like transmembrane domain-containing protein [Acidimicrobiia bacterium]